MKLVILFACLTASMLNGSYLRYTCKLKNEPSGKSAKPVRVARAPITSSLNSPTSATSSAENSPSLGVSVQPRMIGGQRLPKKQQLRGGNPAVVVGSIAAAIVFVLHPLGVFDSCCCHSCQSDEMWCC